MAPPATKRRKLEHSDSEAESEGSFAGFDDTNGVELDGSDAEDAFNDDSDVSMNGAEEMEGVDQDMSDEEEGEEEQEEEDEFEVAEDVHPSRKQTTAGQAASTSKPPKRPALSLQDGVYTAETFKSNMFKLQVDELLDQVKLKYGKKEAPAENAMRTLKTVIEQIPDRDPLSVRTSYEYRKRILISSRLLKPRKRSNQPASQYPSQARARQKTPCTSCSTSDQRA
jgi:U3 small nucleolar RNA-associated protein 22